MKDVRRGLGADGRRGVVCGVCRTRGVDADAAEGRAVEEGGPGQEDWRRRKAVFKSGGKELRVLFGELYDFKTCHMRACFSQGSCNAFGLLRKLHYSA